MMLDYPVIDLRGTGRHLRQECEQRNISARELQEFLGLSTTQSVYSWFQGKTLPSLDNFYALSFYLGKQMEELLVAVGVSTETGKKRENHLLGRRQMAYYGFCLDAISRQFQTAGCKFAH